MPKSNDLSGGQFDESDEDFINGAVYVYEKPKRGRSKRTSPKRLSAKKQTAGRPRANPSRNPLLKYLGPELSQLSIDAPTSGHETEGESSSKEEDGSLSDEDASERDSHDAKPLNVKPGATRLRPSRRNIYEGSDEGDEETQVSQKAGAKRAATEILRGAKPKKQKVEPKQEDGSATETESETEPDSGYSDYVKQYAKANARQADSETEEETEEDKAFTAQLLSQDEKTAGSRNAKPQLPSREDHPWLGLLLLDADPYIHIPGPINRYLRGYQRDGIKFFYKQWKKRCGGILGDDMGLGKTIQVISFLSAIMQKEGNDRDLERRHNFVSQWQNREDWRSTLPKANATWPTCLIIAPSTVVHNWERELETWGYFEVGIYTGANRKGVLTDFKLGRLDIVVTSFEVASKDIEDLDDLAWSCVFVDEAHRLKNHKAKTTQALDRIACPCRFALTGTAIQNDYGELWTILDWTNPGQVGTKEQWNACISKPLKDGQSSKATEEQIAKARILASQLVYKLLPDFFLRRTKAIIAAHMPNKTDMVVFCPMSQLQLTVYERFLERCPPPSSENLKYISIFMKLSNHLAMILPAPTGDGPEKFKKDEVLKKEAFPDGDAPKYGEAIMRADCCGKLKGGILQELFKEWKANKEEKNKVLIFSRSVKLLDMLDYQLNYEGHFFVKLDGSTKQSDRMPLIDRFNHDPSVFCFLISTLAGGTGLNLTSANKVVIFDPNWNPAHDLQAIDRAFRIGQRRNVTVFRLLAAGTIEEHIYRRQIYKQQQMAIGYEASMQTRYFAGVQGQKGKEGDLFGVKNLFSLNKNALATKRTIERAHQDQLLWSLAHLESSSQSTTDDHGSDVADLKGLANFLLNDETPGSSSAGDEIKHILGSLGVQYMHQNDEVLKPSHIEGMVAQKAIKASTSRRRAKQRTSESTSKKADPSWPPKRKHANKRTS